MQKELAFQEEYFGIIQALCRSALANPSDAVVNQVERLKVALEKDGYSKEAKSLGSLLTMNNKSSEMTPSKIERSFIVKQGEELTRRTPVPVDKETATPIAEIIFADDLPQHSPYFSSTVTLAIDSILTEWKNFKQLLDIQSQPSRSCLIYGLPGTGKTQLALWMAREINMPVVLARLDGLMSSFLGTTSKNISNLFTFAAKYRCILLLDEFDAIAKLRNDPQEVGEIKRVVNTLLQNLDTRKSIGFTIGITNHETLLDPAIWRRFDVQLEIPKPSPEAIGIILKKSMAPLVLSEIEMNFLSWVIYGASGADAETLAKWLKKSYSLNPQESLIELIRRFTILNAGRIDSLKKSALIGPEDVLINALVNDPQFPFKQKDLASLMKTSPSAISKQISKSK